MTSGRAVVIGLGRTGLACARVLATEGFTVLAVDRGSSPEIETRVAGLPREVEVVLGGYSDDVVVGANLVCPSPGVRWDAPELQLARRLGIPIQSEMDLVFQRCPAPIIGVTGTNGKTTTTALVVAMLRAGGLGSHTGGNIGVPGVEPVISRLGEVRPEDWVVLELSSFQLESVARPRCAIAAVLNLTPDHLDRHGSFAAYRAAKERLVVAAEGTVVLSAGDPIVRAMAGLSRVPSRLFGADLGGSDGCTVIGGDVVSIEGGEATIVMPVTAIPLYGAHNVANVLAAVAVARAAGVAPTAIAAAVRGFHAVQHRLEPVLERRGVLWIDDSKATNVDSAVKALEAFAGRSVVWIGGGRSKGVAPDALADAVVRHARHAILNGATAAELDGALAARDYRARTVVGTLGEAVRAAEVTSRPGDVILLAPGYPSFDQFVDFEERGRAFVAAVQGLDDIGEAC